jgi:nucleoside-diphosphate-sugar epimerase
MKAFITGATGFVGSFLTESLLKKKYDVRCLVRKTSNLRWIADLDVECHYGSLNDKNSLMSGVKDCDVVYHVAGLTNALTEDDYFAANFTGTKNLIDACLESNNHLSKFIHISSQAAVGPSPTITPIDETHPPNPVTFYGKSKLAAEQYVLEQNNKLNTTILRPPAVYGPRDTDILEFFRTVKMGLIPRMGGKDKYLSLIHVKDLARGIIMAAESEKSSGEIYFITSNKPHSQEEFSRIILKILHKKGIKIPIPISVLKSIAWIGEGIASFTKKPSLMNQQRIIDMKQDYWTCSGNKAKNDFGFNAEISLENGVRETLVWYQENKWL